MCTERRTPGRERGATGLEYGAMILVGTLVVGAVFFAVVTQSDLIGRTTAAVCRIFQGSDCEEMGGSVESALERALAGNYVALGDSFASGEGAGDYREGTDYDHRDDWDWDNWGDDDHNRCHRSQNSYAENVYRQMATAGTPFAGTLTTAYCSGATTNDFDNPNGSHTGEEPQKTALDDETSLVTLSIGGNDLGFGKVLQDCVINGARGPSWPIARCQTKWDAELDTRLDALLPVLVAEYTDIKKRAPNARIVVMGYPPLFNEPPADSLKNLLFAEDQQWMNEKAAELNAVIRKAARQAGVEFIDPTNAFKGHGLGSSDPWFNDLDLDGPGISLVDPGSFHPNAAGHAAYAELLKDQLIRPEYP